MDSIIFNKSNSLLNYSSTMNDNVSFNHSGNIESLNNYKFKVQNKDVQLPVYIRRHNNEENRLFNNKNVNQLTPKIDKDVQSSRKIGNSRPISGSSYMWDYYERDVTGKYVYCTLCPNNERKFSYSGGTSTMTRHLRLKHDKYPPGKEKSDYNNDKKQKNNQIIHKESNPIKKLKIQSIETDELHNQDMITTLLNKNILHYILSEYRPLSSLSSNRMFHNMINNMYYSIKEMNNLYSPDNQENDFHSNDTNHINNIQLPLPLPLPSETELRILLSEMQSKKRDKLTEILNSTEYISLSIQDFKSQFHQRILTFTGHWINDKLYEVRNCILEVYVLPIDEMADVSVALREVMNKWNLSNKLIAIVIGTSEDTIDQDYSSILDITDKKDTIIMKCAISIIKQAGRVGFNKASSIINKIRKFTSFFLQNPSENHSLMLAQRSINNKLDNKINRFKQNDNIKGISLNSEGNPAFGIHCHYGDDWNSICNMIYGVIELEEALSIYKQSLAATNGTFVSREPIISRYKTCDLNEEDWYIIKEISALIRPISKFINNKKNSYYYFPSFSMIHPVFISIKKHLQEASTWLVSPISRMIKDEMLDIFNRTCSNSNIVNIADIDKTGLHVVKDISILLLGKRHADFVCLLDPTSKSLSFIDKRDKILAISRLRHLYKKLKDKIIRKEKKISNNMNKNNNKIIYPFSEAKNDPTRTLLNDLFSSLKGDMENNNNNNNVNINNNNNNNFNNNSKNSVNVSSNDTTSKEIKENTDNELDRYLTLSYIHDIDDIDDPLKWWKEYSTDFPVLSKIAKKYLAIPAASITLFDAFTNTGGLLAESRARIELDIIAQFIFCHSAIHNDDLLLDG